jgi:dienelactone hydrolase
MIRIAITLMICAAGLGTASAQDTGETVKIPLEGIELEAVVHKPSGPGPFPVVIFNHGTLEPPLGRGRADNPLGFANYLTARGIALVVPMRKGFADSGGESEESFECSANAVKQGLDAAMKSLVAAHGYLQKTAWVDANKLVWIGHARGGVLATAFAAQYPDRALASMNFSGAWVSERCVVAAKEDFNAPLFKQAGGLAKKPSAFFYGTADRSIPPALADSYVKAFTEAGGKTAYYNYRQATAATSYSLFFNYQRLWLSEFDAFMKTLGFPMEER